MIRILLHILSMDGFEGLSEEIEVAKGKYKLHTNFRDAWKQHKRKKW